MSVMTPGSRCRKWSIAGLICLVILNVHFLGMAIEQSLRQNGWTFDVDRNQVTMLRDAKGEPVKLAVGRPPSAFEFEGEVPAFGYYGVANAAIGIGVLILLWRAKQNTVGNNIIGSAERY